MMIASIREWLKARQRQVHRTDDRLADASATLDRAEAIVRRQQHAANQTAGPPRTCPVYKHVGPYPPKAIVNW